MQNAIVLRLQLQLRGALTQPIQCDLQTLSCKTHAIEVRTTTRTISHKLQRFAAPKPDLDAKAEKRRFLARFKRDFQRKIINVKMKKIAAKAPFATFMQPLQCDVGLSDLKRNSIALAAALRGTLTQPCQCDRQTHADTECSCEASFKFQELKM